MQFTQYSRASKANCIDRNQISSCLEGGVEGKKTAKGGSDEKLPVWDGWVPPGWEDPLEDMAPSSLFPDPQTGLKAGYSPWNTLKIRHNWAISTAKFTKEVSMNEMWHMIFPVIQRFIYLYSPKVILCYVPETNCVINNLYFKF